MLRKKWEEVRKIPDSNLRAAIIRCQDPMLLVKLQVGFRECFADDDQPEGKYLNRSALIELGNGGFIDQVVEELGSVVTHVVLPVSSDVNEAIKHGASIAPMSWVGPLKYTQECFHRARWPADLPLFEGQPMTVELDGVSYYYAHGDAGGEAWLIRLDLIDLET